MFFYRVKCPCGLTTEEAYSGAGEDKISIAIYIPSTGILRQHRFDYAEIGVSESGIDEWMVANAKEAIAKAYGPEAAIVGAPDDDARLFCPACGCKEARITVVGIA